MNYDQEKYEYCLCVYGPMFDTPEVIGEGLAAGKHYFDTYGELWHFIAELKIVEHKFKTPPLRYEIREGRAVRYYTVVKLLYLYNFVTYQVEYKFDFLCDHKICQAFFTDAWNGVVCDCSRASLIRTTDKEFPVLSCGKTIELLSCKMEDVKYEK